MAEDGGHGGLAEEGGMKGLGGGGRGSPRVVGANDPLLRDEDSDDSVHGEAGGWRRWR